MLSKKNSCQTIVTSRKQIVQENIQQWWQTNAPTETGLTQNYGIIQKCIENGLPHSKGILRISKVYRQMANNCTTSVRRTKMSRFFGYCLSIVEEFFFLGFISAIVQWCFFIRRPWHFLVRWIIQHLFQVRFFLIYFSRYFYILYACYFLLYAKKKVGFTEKNIQIIHLPLTLFSIYIMIWFFRYMLFLIEKKHLFPQLFLFLYG